GGGKPLHIPLPSPPAPEAPQAPSPGRRVRFHPPSIPGERPLSAPSLPRSGPTGNPEPPRRRRWNHGIMPGNHLQHVGGVLHTLRQRSDLIQRRGKGDETEAGNAPV